MELDIAYKRKYEEFNDYKNSKKVKSSKFSDILYDDFYCNRKGGFFESKKLINFLPKDIHEQDAINKLVYEANIFFIQVIEKSILSDELITLENRFRREIENIPNKNLIKIGVLYLVVFHKYFDYSFKEHFYITKNISIKFLQILKNYINIFTEESFLAMLQS